MDRIFQRIYPFLLATLPVIGVQAVKGQSQLDQVQNQLDQYIRQGLAGNQSIKQQSFTLERNIYALGEAKTMFLPEVSFSTTYSKAEGGRTIDVPVGDLLNGAYTTLNRLTGSNSFPTLQNQHILINPDNFYDARFRATLPILNAELAYNKRIKQQQVDWQRAAVLLYKRQLVKDIKTAYYHYLKAINATRIYEFALRLVEEGQRINTRLYDNGKVNRTAVVRSENEVSRINASLISARKTAESARYYFNFLLNRPLTDSIIPDEITTLPAADQPQVDTISSREELTQLRIAKEINRNLNGLAKSYLIPKIGTYLDLGSQAFNWRFDNQSRYYFWGISVEWDLFASGRNAYKIKQTVADRNALQSQTDYVRQQLLTELRVRQADMQSAIAQYAAAETQVKASETYYRDMLKLYREGMAIYIELLDAQNQLIDARLHANISLFDTWIAYAAVERANASFTLQ